MGTKTKTFGVKKSKKEVQGDQSPKGPGKLPPAPEGGTRGGVRRAAWCPGGNRVGREERRGVYGGECVWGSLGRGVVHDRYSVVGAGA